MNAIQTPLMARLVPVALVSLGLLLASPAGAASMTEAERCAWKADKVEGRYARCLTRSATRLSNVLSGSTQEEDAHCAEQFSRSMDVLERRASFKDVGEECLARISEDGQNAAQAEALVAAGRDLADYPDLGVDDLADSPIGDYLDQSYGAGYDTGYDVGYDEGEASVDVASNDQSVYDDGYDAGYDTGYDVGYDEGEASVDVASNDQSVCEAADGTWENDACTPAPAASSYNCFVGGFCAQTAIEFPPGVFPYTNVYEGHTQGTEPALGAGCNLLPGSGLHRGEPGGRWDEGTALALSVLPCPTYSPCSSILLGLCASN